jgi:hypothetical protein
MTNGGTVPVPPLVMVVQTVYHTAKLHCHDDANMIFFFMVQQSFCSTNTNQQVDD